MKLRYDIIKDMIIPGAAVAIAIIATLFSLKANLIASNANNIANNANDTANKANDIAETGNELAQSPDNPWFIIKVDKNGDYMSYAIDNIGGHIHNVSIELLTVVCLYKNNNASNLVYYPYNSVQENFYDVNSDMYSFIDPVYDDKIDELTKLYENYFDEEHNPITTFYFMSIYIKYIDGSRLARTDKYLLGRDFNYTTKTYEYFLSPMEESLSASIEAIFPDMFRESYEMFPMFPSGTIISSRLYGGRESGTDSSQNIFNESISSIEESLQK